MKKKNIPEKSCAFCENGQRLIDDESALCRHKGAVALDFCCRKFVFDPLKAERSSKKLILNTKIETL